MKSGVYETVYGNGCIYDKDESEDTAYDMDMAETIPVEMVDFSQLISEDIHNYY